MASLVLGVAGSALGSSLLGEGFSLFGATITGAQIGGAIGAFAGSMIDSALSPGSHTTRQGPRLSNVNIQASTEGAPIPRLFGRCRIAGQVIWASRFQESQSTATTSSGGKGGPSASVTQTDYSYAISFAVGLCEGAITALGRVWAGGNLIDLSRYTTRLYLGTEDQAADPLIAEIEGDGNTPCYRGLAYIVFEDMPLADFGNRIPQLQFEILRSLGAANPQALENRLQGVALIPGAGEFVLATDVVTADDGQGGTVAQNAHVAATEADITASLDALQSVAPALGAVSLVVGWFASDLRCGQCEIRPGVEIARKDTYPAGWSVGGVTRAAAHLVSQIGGRPAYGGTPSDDSVVQAIADLKARGLRVLFNPFLFMDIAPGTGLPDPYGGSAGQPAFPWRGRITCDPAPGVAGSPDKTAAAAAQVNAFFGSAAPGDFSVSGTSLAYGGPDEWSLRRMVLHYAHLCAAAGGVDAFLIGSELVGLNHVRDGAASYPAVAALKVLAADVRSILGPGTRIGYGADWSEYNGHQTGDAPGALLFNLDPLWADADIDFIGIDNYMKLADWRDGTDHLDYDAAAGPTTTYDPAYLASNIRGGEDYDWYYAGTADRDAQNRTPICEWQYRAKDLWGWWSNAHYDRPDGHDAATPTAFVPQSKPIWFTELGCPAVDKGANEPNVFTDPKSSESALPYYSSGARDDLIQRRFLEAHLNFWADGANNPTSSVYGAPMVDAANIYAWCWDARPFPFFPARAELWGDAGNWRLGHWLNGRLGAIALADLVRELCAPFAAVDASQLAGLVTGFAVTDTMSARDALTPLFAAHGFDAVESQGAIRFMPRGRPDPLAISSADLVLGDKETGFGFAVTRAQETDLPQTSRIGYIDDESDYRQAMASAGRLVGGSARIAQSSLPLVLDQGTASAIAARLLMEAWAGRETATLALPPSRLALDPCDEVIFTAPTQSWRLRLTQIDDAGARSLEAVATDPSLYDAMAGPARAPGMSQALRPAGRALVAFLDLPWLDADATPYEPYAAAIADPWPGAVLLLKSPGTDGFALDTALKRAATMGETLAPFYSGPTSRWDRVNTLGIKLYRGALQSRDAVSVLGGANALALQNPDGGWEVLQFATATLTAPGEWRLSDLLRGQAGSEGAMRDPVPAGARVVLLDGAPAQLHLKAGDVELPFNWLYGPQGKPLCDPAFQSATLQFAAMGLKPFAPCGLQAVFDDSGDLVLSWIRRDRNPGADGWSQSEVAMSEAVERYDLEILDGAGSLRRTATVTAARFTYDAAAIAADFPGGLPRPFRFTVYQLSDAVGRGPGKSAMIHLT